MKTSRNPVWFYFMISFVLQSYANAVSSVNANEVNPESSRYHALGQGFFIPDEHLLSSELTARGATIFDSFPKKCIIETSVGVDRKDESFYSTTKSLYSAISTDTDVDLSLKGEFTMGATLRAVTNNLAMKDSHISGNSLQLYAESKDYSLSMDCINSYSLNKDFIRDFKKLNQNIKSPWLKKSWEQYAVFLRKYGSHAVKTILGGSSIYQYAFAETDKDYSQRNFTVKACASLAGPTDVGELGLSACSGVTKDEINKVAKLKMVSKLVVRGGTIKTRAKLINARNKDTIESFLQEGKTDPSPIIHKFIPIWDILQARYIGTPFMAQARNLEEYYKGYLDYGCSYKKTANEKTLQKFIPTEESSPDFPSYQCILGPEGCHEDNDCHYRAAFWCACGGQSCVRYREKMLNSGFTKTEANAYKPDTSYWGWHGCRLSGLKCFCTAPSNTIEVVWRDDRQHILQNVHININKRRIQDEAKIRALEKRCKHNKH